MFCGHKANSLLLRSHDALQLRPPRPIQENHKTSDGFQINTFKFNIDSPFTMKGGCLEIVLLHARIMHCSIMMQPHFDFHPCNTTNNDDDNNNNKQQQQTTKLDIDST